MSSVSASIEAVTGRCFDAVAKTASAVRREAGLRSMAFAVPPDRQSAGSRRQWQQLM